MISAKMTTVTHDISMLAMVPYYVLAFLLLAAGFSVFGKVLVSWLLNRLYDLALGW